MTVATMQGHHLLVVSASDELGSSLSEALKAQGHEPRWEHDGNAASAALDGPDVDAVVVDLHLPGLSVEALRRALAPEGGTRTPPPPLDVIERQHIQDTLRFTKGNRRHAAHLLGIARSTLLAKIRRYGLDHDGPGEE